MPPLLSATHIKKAYGQIPALVDAHIEVREGEIHALLGENGAGKTTLMNILYGLLRPDSGEIAFAGTPYTPQSPLDANAMGVSMVHQHFMLVPTLTVAENILLGESPFSVYRSSKEKTRLENEMRDFGFDLPLSTRTRELSVGELQRVEIFKALRKGARLLILDEPTALLTPGQTEELFGMLRAHVERGQSVLFISHKLNEIEDHCDRVTILRKGETVGCFPIEETDRGELSRLVVGHEIESASRREPAGSRSMGSSEEDVFHVSFNGSGGSSLCGDWSFEIEPGKLIAIVGVEGNGQKELAEAILGLAHPPGFEVRLGGATLPSDARRRIDSGMGLISEDRQRTGLVLDFSVAENLALKDINDSPWSQHGWLSRKGSNEQAQSLVDEYSIHPSDTTIPASRLSGGNQQKTVVAREISRDHRLLVAVNPTRGLDVGAQAAVGSALIRDIEEGAAVLLITTELEEAVALADRLYVLFKGHVAEITEVDWNPATIGLAMLGVAGGAVVEV